MIRVKQLQYVVNYLQENKNCNVTCNCIIKLLNKLLIFILCESCDKMFFVSFLDIILLELKHNKNKYKI